MAPSTRSASATPAARSGPLSVGSPLIEPSPALIPPNNRRAAPGEGSSGLRRWPALLRQRLLVPSKVDVFVGIVQHLFRLAILAAQRQHGGDALHVDRRLAREALLSVEQDVVRFGGKLWRHGRQVLAKQRDRGVTVPGIVEPGEAGDI